MDVVIPTIKSPDEVSPLVKLIGETAGMPLRVIVTSVQGSASCNRNFGLQQSAGDIVFMLDDDIAGLSHGWAVRMMDTMQRRPLCVMVSLRLLNPDGSLQHMTGGASHTVYGEEVIQSQTIPTACIAIRHHRVKFDEAFIGSGFEDNDYCNQLRDAVPGAEFVCLHNVFAIHINEKKNQGGSYWKANQRYYWRKWGGNRESRPIVAAMRERRKRILAERS